MTTMPDAVGELLAKQAITEVLYSYCRGLDRMDRALADTVWHPGGTADYGPMFQGTGAEFLDWVWKTHENFTAHSHQITNILIRLEPDVQHALSETYLTVVLRTPVVDGTVSDLVDRARYVDRWSLRDGRWGIDHRRLIDDFQAIYTMAANAATDGSSATGRRDRTDPSYGLGMA